MGMGEEGGNHVQMHQVVTEHTLPGDGKCMDSGGVQDSKRANGEFVS